MESTSKGCSPPEPGVWVKKAQSTNQCKVRPFVITADKTQGFNKSPPYQISKAAAIKALGSQLAELKADFVSFDDPQNLCETEKPWKNDYLTFQWSQSNLLLFGHVIWDLNWSLAILGQQTRYATHNYFLKSGFTENVLNLDSEPTSRWFDVETTQSRESRRSKLHTQNVMTSQLRDLMNESGRVVNGEADKNLLDSKCNRRGDHSRGRSVL